MNRHMSAAAGCLALAMATSGFAQTLTLYEVASVTAADLGTLGGNEAEASDINNNGVIVGWARQADGLKRAFYYVTSMKAIGPSLQGVWSEATGVNDRGEVVGHYEDFHKVYPFYWHKNVGYVRMRDLAYHEDVDYADKYVALPKAINLHAQVAGGSYFRYGEGYPASPPDYCFIEFPVKWQTPYSHPHSLYCPLNGFPPNTAYDINDSGEIAATEQSATFLGFVWKDGVRDEVPFPEEVPSHLRNGMVFGINEPGRVVGAAIHDVEGSIHNKKRALYWNRYSPYSKDLGVLPGGNESEAYEINDADFVVGYSNAPIPGTSLPPATRLRAFLWHKTFGMYSLPLPNGHPATSDCVANSLNNRVEQTGLIQVVGYCTGSGRKRAIRWNVIVSKQTISIGM